MGPPDAAKEFDAALASFFAAPQHEPRPLPLFVQIMLQQCNGDVARIARTLAGVRAYQAAKRQPREAVRPVLFRQGRTRVLDYGGNGRPVLFVPSLINPPFVLDLAPGNSMLGWLSTRGVRPLLLDWGDPRAGDQDLSIAGHVERHLLPVLDQLGKDILLAGYCLGGTMTLAAALCKPVAGLILIAAPWDFSAYPESTPRDMLALWEQAGATAAALGVFPMEMLQALFWRLDPDRTIKKYAEFGAMKPDSAEARNFVALEDWANEGPPLTVAAAQDLLESFFGANMTGTGQWKVDGRSINPPDLAVPVLNIRSSNDRIVPAATAPSIGTDLLLDQGHVGMVVGRSAPTRLWSAIDRWLSEFR